MVVKTHIVCTSVDLKSNRSPRVFSHCRTTSEPGEEVAAAKVLEPPGPEVMEEGGQAPACGWAKQVALEHPSGLLDHHD